eukprot:Skav229463  [mRNA]  locus=scaffold577:147481:148630:+ [translate_table: standard]
MLRLLPWQLSRVEIHKSPVAPASVAGTMSAAVPAHAASEVPTLKIPDKEITSTNFKKEWLLLGRVAAGPRAAEFPQLAKAFGSGTKAEQRDVLKRYLQHGGNLEAIETTFTVERSHEGELEGTRELLTIDGMRKAGCSEAKIAACVARGGIPDKDCPSDEASCVGRGVIPDKDCPSDEASMKFWCHLSEKETTRDKFKVQMKAKANAQPGAMVDALGAAFPSQNAVHIENPAQMIANRVAAAASSSPADMASPAPAGPLCNKSII